MLVLALFSGRQRYKGEQRKVWKCIVCAWGAACEQGTGKKCNWVERMHAPSSHFEAVSYMLLLNSGSPWMLWPEFSTVI